MNISGFAALALRNKAMAAKMARGSAIEGKGQMRPNVSRHFRLGEPGVVIVGAGFGGMEVGKRLQRARVGVTIIDRNNYTLFQPLLYQVATAALSPADVAVPIRSLLRSPTTEVLLDDVVAVDSMASRVSTASGIEIPFKFLVLATGSQSNYFGHTEWQKLAASPKSLDDALAIRNHLLLAFERAEMCRDDVERRELMTFVVIGGGPTGVEMAGAIAELAKATLVQDFRHIDPTSARVLLIEGGPRILPEFSQELGAYAQKALTRLGVELHLNTRIDHIDNTGVVAAGQRIATQFVVWGAGVKATPIAAWLGIEPSQRGTVEVNPDFSVPGLSNVFVIGDAAHFVSPNGGPLPGLAAVAKQEGQYVGEVICRRIDGRMAAPAFRYRDYGTMATIGRSAAVADLRGLKLKGAIAWFLWGIVHLYFLIGFRNRLLVLVNWFWAWLTYARGARLITYYQAGSSFLQPRLCHAENESKAASAMARGGESP